MNFFECVITSRNFKITSFLYRFKKLSLNISNYIAVIVNVNNAANNLGFIIINDKLSSSMQNIKVSGIYSYETILSKKIHLRTGLEAALWQNKLNYDQLNRPLKL